MGIPIKFKNEPGRVNFDLPKHGEHSAEILEGLGYSADDVAALKDSGAI
jgi:formyl-CoA transferase